MVAVASRPNVLKRMARLLAGTAMLCLMAGGPALAQEGLTSALSAEQAAADDEAMVVKATEMIYDNDGNTVTATGNVQIYYGGRVLQADRVVYDRTGKRVKAFGNVRITERDGTVSTADELDLSDDFREGFVNSLRLETVDKTRFAASRAERVAGNITVFENGVYTACEPCKDNPEKPPFWQVKAARIIHNKEERMVYFEDARLEFFGTPIAFVPYFSAPDPTVKRKSGVLTPTYYATSQLGVGVDVPYYIALAPNYDLTLSPGLTTKQGPMMQATWRHRLMTGSYSIRAAGAFQMDPDAFRVGAQDDARGTIESSGQFAINQNWVWGWDLTLASDKFFREDYNIDKGTRNEAISSLYLTGIGSRSYFDIRNYYFLGLTEADVQKQLPMIHPVMDWDYVVDKPVLGGEVGWNVNLTSLSRNQADFDQTIGGAACDGVSAISTPRDQCLLHGIDGNYTRLSANLYWKRTFTDPIGQRWTPFAYLRGDMAWTAVDSPVTETFVGGSEEFLGRALPAIGLDYRYPLIHQASFGTQIFEPVAQVIVRPKLAQVGKLPNEDAQSLLFDDTNLFEWDKYSGYDRLEDGSRLNAGFQYTLTTNSGASLNAMFGQSYVLGGTNPYETADMANTGLNSGLDKKRSDYVARIMAQPTDTTSLVARARFDEETFALERLEVAAAGSIGRVSGDVTYGRYAEQPKLGLDRREGMRSNASVKLNDNWTAKGGFLYDFDAKQFSTASFGLAYLDECYSMAVTASRTFSTIAGEDPVDKIMLQLSLRTLGDASFSQTLSRSEE